jgi:hypothetical protein
LAKKFIVEEKGFVEIALILVCLALLGALFLISGSVRSQYQLVEAYCTKVSRDYRFEGVLCEAVSRIKRGEETIDAASSFAEGFCFTAFNGKITLKHESGAFWEAEYSREEAGVVVKNLVTPFTLPYVR